MARSTPAQNDRGPASSTWRGPQAAAQRSATGGGGAQRAQRGQAAGDDARHRMDRRVDDGPDHRHRAIPGRGGQRRRLHVGEQRAVGGEPGPFGPADQMVHGGDPARPGGQPGPAQLAGQQRSRQARWPSAAPRCRPPGRPGRGRRSARRRHPSRPAGRTGWLSARPARSAALRGAVARAQYLARGSALVRSPRRIARRLDAHGGTDDRSIRRSCRVVASGPHVAAERADREDQPVQVVVDVEVAGEAGAGEPAARPRCRRRAACPPASAMPRSVAAALRAPRRRAGRAAPTRSATRWTRPGRPAPGRRRSAGPRPSRRPGSGAAPARPRRGGSTGLPGLTPAAISAGTTAPVP